MQQTEMQATELGFTVRRPVRSRRRHRLVLAGAALVAAIVLAVAGVFGWQQLTQRSAKASIEPAAAGSTRGGRPRVTLPFDGSNPLPCKGDAKPPIKLKGHALPVCPPALQNGTAPSATPAPSGALF